MQAVQTRKSGGVLANAKVASKKRSTQKRKTTNGNGTKKQSDTKILQQ